MIKLTDMTKEQKLIYYQGQIELMQSIAGASINIAAEGFTADKGEIDLFIKLVRFCTEITLQTRQTYKELQEND